MRWLALSAVVLGCFVAFMPGPTSLDDPARIDGLRRAAATLRGDGFRSDLAADYVSARALGSGRGTAYPDFAPSFAKVGIDWQVIGHNTHPPTAFVTVLPVAWLKWPAASAAWAWLVLVGFAVTNWALGARLPIAFALAPVWLLWPPAAWSLGQLTVIWLTGAALAYRWRDRPRLAGVALGIAALPKLLPALLLAPFLLRRQWTALWGFAAVWILALLAVVGLNPSAVPDYLTVGREESQRIIALRHQSALLPNLLGTSTILLGAAGLAVLAFLAYTRANWRLWEWAAVALLPIMWVYSLVPLGTIVVDGWRRGRLPHKIAAVLVLVLPWIIKPFAIEWWLILATLAAAAVAAVPRGWRNPGEVPDEPVAAPRPVSRAPGRRVDPARVG